MFFSKLFRREDPAEEATLRLYSAVVEQARDPVFYAHLAVPDTVNGRFDMMVIHAMLVLRRLREGGAEAERVGKSLLELLFRDMDRSLREMGVGDMGIGRHIKRMAKALFGRAQAYEAGLDGDDEALSAALKDNLYRQSQPSDAQLAGMGEYLRRAAHHVGGASIPEIIAGRIDLDVPVLTADANA
jgi:cytochrome b pre-mRNA-processing protein 3